MAVAQVCPRGIEPQHVLLRDVEVFGVVFPETRAVFEVAAEHPDEKLRRYFVVLFVRSGGVQRHRAAPERVDQRGKPRGACSRRVAPFFLQAIANQPSNLAPYQEVRYVAAFGNGIAKSHQAISSN